MPINLTEFRKIDYEDGQKLFFDKKYSFHTHFKHSRKTNKFPFHKNVLLFLKESPDVSIYFTLDEEVKSFIKVDTGFVINMIAYHDFCKTIGSKTGGRCKAFLGQNLSLKDINFSEEDKDTFIKIHASEKNIIDSIRSFDAEVQDRIKSSINSIKIIENRSSEKKDINQAEFIEAFSRFLTNPDIQNIFYANLPRIQIETLKSHKEFLLTNLNQDEKYIQNWLDEEQGKYRKQRCLIFGVEFVDPKREGSFMRKRFDILAEQNLSSHILIELKSPNAEIFSIKQTPTINDGVTTEYSLSLDLARAIPQILGYKKWYENARPEEIQALGIDKKSISKCIIVVGTRKEDLVWEQNFNSLKGSFNIEICTYTDLIDRLDNTIKNLEQSLIY